MQSFPLESVLYIWDFVSLEKRIATQESCLFKRTSLPYNTRLPSLATNVLEFRISQRKIRDDGKHESQLIPYITAVITDQLGNYTYIIGLHHA